MAHAKHVGTYAGASGKLDPITSQEYGSQDFFGVIDELRIWRTVRTEEQIREVGLHSVCLSMHVALALSGTDYRHPTCRHADWFGDLWARLSLLATGNDVARDSDWSLCYISR